MIEFASNSNFAFEGTVQRQNVCRSLSSLLLLITLVSLPLRQAHADPQHMRLASLDVVLMEDGIFGIASTYDPRGAKEPEGMETASGETYDADAWTAAIQIDLRDAFGGVRYGRNYRPAFALVECGRKRAIVRINDVGPLMPGRIIDLNARAMRYFDPTLELGLIRNTVVTPLPGDGWVTGPVDDGEEDQTIVLSARQH
jgi:rare lipoprotein A